MSRLFINLADHLSNIGRGFAGLPIERDRSVFDVNFSIPEDFKIEGIKEDRENLRRDCNLVATDLSTSLDSYKKERAPLYI